MLGGIDYFVMTQSLITCQVDSLHKQVKDIRRPLTHVALGFLARYNESDLSWIEVEGDYIPRSKTIPVFENDREAYNYAANIS
jgi:hypothetical protein